VKQIAEQQDRKQLIVNDNISEIGDVSDIQAPVSSL
jgi:hypothetical protein